MQHLKIILADRTISPSTKGPGLLVGKHILLGGGPLSSLLDVSEQVQIDKIFLVDIHLDYISDIGFLVDSCFGKRATPFEVWAHPQTIELFKRHFFNNAVWPDFSKIPNPENPSLTLHSISPGESLEWKGVSVHAHEAAKMGSLSFEVKTGDKHFLYAPEGHVKGKANYDFALWSSKEQAQGQEQISRHNIYFANTRQNDLDQLKSSMAPFLG